MRILVGGFNPAEKYSSRWESSKKLGVNIKKYLKPPSRNHIDINFVKISLLSVAFLTGSFLGPLRFLVEPKKLGFFNKIALEVYSLA